jgi:hypothetical protein
MHFNPIIERWGEARLAAALGLHVKNVRSWIAQDSIPGGWFARVAATGIATLEELAVAGTGRERKSEADRAAKRAMREATRQDVAA